MKVLFLVPELFASEGGIPRILRLYLKALCELAEPNGEVRLVVLNDQTLDSTDLRAYGSDRLTDWVACHRHKRRFTLAALAQARSVDLLICGHVGQLPVARLCRMRYPKLRYTLIAHGIEVWRKFSPIERFALRGASQIWCVSDFTRRELLRRSRLKPDRAIVLANGLDPAFQPGHGGDAPGASPVLLAVSRLSHADRYKGIDHLIEAMPIVREKIPNAVLRIVGRGDDLPRLQALAAQKSLVGAVQFAGYIGDAELADEFSRCRVFALPSEREGFGLVYVEAMAHGKPCVGANAGGTPEVITPETGVLCPYGDVPAVARACVEALTKTWSVDAIQARAETFSYASFRNRLKALLPA